MNKNQIKMYLNNINHWKKGNFFQVCSKISLLPHCVYVLYYPLPFSLTSPFLLGDIVEIICNV